MGKFEITDRDLKLAGRISRITIRAHQERFIAIMHLKGEGDE